MLVCTVVAPVEGIYAVATAPVFGLTAKRHFARTKNGFAKSVSNTDTQHIQFESKRHAHQVNRGFTGISVGSIACGGRNCRWAETRTLAIFRRRGNSVFAV